MIRHLNKIFRLLSVFLFPAAVLLSGCSMHPPSASSFMQAVENGGYAASISAKKLYNNLSEDEWEMPVGLDLVSSNANGIALGVGLLPSPYFTIGTGNKYFGVRTWMSALWLGAMLAVFDESNNEDLSEEDKETIDDITSVLLNLFSGGFSIIEQLPIGSIVRIGLEEFIARNFWISHWEQDDFSNFEVGAGAYLTINAYNHHFTFEGRYSLIDFNIDKDRLTLSLIYTLTFGNFK